MIRDKLKEFFLRALDGAFEPLVTRELVLNERILWWVDKLKDPKLKRIRRPLSSAFAIALDDPKAPPNTLDKILFDCFVFVDDCLRQAESNEQAAQRKIKELNDALCTGEAELSRLREALVKLRADHAETGNALLVLQRSQTNLKARLQAQREFFGGNPPDGYADLLEFVRGSIGGTGIEGASSLISVALLNLKAFAHLRYLAALPPLYSDKGASPEEVGEWVRIGLVAMRKDPGKPL